QVDLKWQPRCIVLFAIQPAQARKENVMQGTHVEHHSHEANTEQSKLWNGLGGRGWVEAQRVLDDMFRPFENLLAESAAEKNARRVLDVGCGTGATTLALARRLSGEGQSVGIDISQPMIAAARARAEQESLPARFIQGDAQTYSFPPESFDRIVSR